MRVADTETVHARTRGVEVIERAEIPEPQGLVGSEDDGPEARSAWISVRYASGAAIPETDARGRFDCHSTLSAAYTNRYGSNRQAALRFPRQRLLRHVVQETAHWEGPRWRFESP